MTRRFAANLTILLFVFAAGLAPDAWAQPAAPKAQAPVLVSSCGQSPGPLKLTVFLKKLGIEHEYRPTLPTRTSRRRSTRPSSSSPARA